MKDFALVIAEIDLKIVNVIDDNFVKRVMATLKTSPMSHLRF